MTSMNRRDALQRGGLFGAIAAVLATGTSVVAARPKDDDAQKLRAELGRLRHEYAGLEILFGPCDARLIEQHRRSMLASEAARVPVAGWETEGGFHAWRPDGVGLRCIACGAATSMDTISGLYDMLEPWLPMMRGELRARTTSLEAAAIEERLRSAGSSGSAAFGSPLP